MYAFGQGQFHLSGDVSDGPLDGDGIPLSGPIHADRDRRVVTHKVGTLPVDAVLADRGHVPDGEGRARCFAAQNDVGYCGGVAFFDARAHACICPRHVARGIGISLRTNSVRDLGEGHVMPDQRDCRHLHHDFRCGDPSDGGARDPSGEKARDVFIGKPRQLIHAHGPGDYHVGHPVAPIAPAHGRLIYAFGQACHGIHSGLHVIGGTRHVPTGFKVQSDGGAPLTGGDCGFGNALNRQERRLQHLGHACVNVLSARAIPGDIDAHVFHDNVGKKLRPHVGQRGQPRHDKTYQ